jgi:hypothetical protein
MVLAQCIKSMLELPTPFVRRDGRKDADSQLVMGAIMRQSRHWRMPPTFVARLACGLWREVATAFTSDLHDFTLGFVVTISETHATTSKT